MRSVSKNICLHGRMMLDPCWCSSFDALRIGRKYSLHTCLCLQFVLCRSLSHGHLNCNDEYCSYCVISQCQKLWSSSMSVWHLNPCLQLHTTALGCQLGTNVPDACLYACPVLLDFFFACVFDWFSFSLFFVLSSQVCCTSSDSFMVSLPIIFTSPQCHTDQHEQQRCPSLVGRDCSAPGFQLQNAQGV